MLRTVVRLFALSALRQEFLFPWKGRAGESLSPGSSSVQNGFTVFLELLFNLSQSPGGCDVNVAVPLGTRGLFNGLLHGQSPKPAGKPSLSGGFPFAAAGSKSIWGVTLSAQQQ